MESSSLARGGGHLTTSACCPLEISIFFSVAAWRRYLIGLIKEGEALSLSLVSILTGRFSGWLILLSVWMYCMCAAGSSRDS